MSPCSMTGTMPSSCRPSGPVAKPISRRISRRQKQVRPAVSSVGGAEGEDLQRGKGTSREPEEGALGADWIGEGGKQGGGSGSIWPVVVCVRSFREGVARYKCEESDEGWGEWGMAGLRGISKSRAMTGPSRARLSFDLPHHPLTSL